MVKKREHNPEINKMLRAYKEGNSLNAFDLCNQILRTDPTNIEVLETQARIFFEAKQFEKSKETLEKLLEIEPDSIEALKTYANLCDIANNKVLALKIYIRLNDLDPNNPWILYNIGGRYKELRNLKEAKKYLLKALDIKPDYKEALKEICPLIAATGDYKKTREYLKSLYALEPKDSTKIILETLCPITLNNSKEIAKWREEYNSKLDKLLGSEINVENPLKEITMRSAFHLAYHNSSNKALNTKLANVYTKASPDLLWTAPHCERKPKKDKQKDKIIRIGFISPHFMFHPVTNSFGNLITQTSKTEDFDTYIFATDAVNNNDSFIWQDFSRKNRAFYLPLDINNARELVAEKELDILVYTELGMNGLSYFLAFSRLAPAQCVLPGHPDTSGINNIDYFISSKCLEPENASEYYSETLILMNSKPFASDVIAPPKEIKNREDLSIPLDKNIYICPIKPHKIHPDFDQVINKIFEKDKEAEIIFFNDRRGVIENIKNRFQKNIKPEFLSKITYYPWAEKDDFFGYLNSADVILDSFYFGVGTTFFFISAVGTPVATMSKEHFRGGRVAQAYYNDIGLSELIADNIDEYVDTATKLASDKIYQNKIREMIIKNRNILFNNKESQEEFCEIFRKLGNDPNAYK